MRIDRRKTNAAYQRRQPNDETGPSSRRGHSRMARYVLVRLATIFLTILVGLFITILVANRLGAIDDIVQRDVNDEVYFRTLAGLWADLSPEELQQKKQQMEAAEGLTLPPLARNLRWLWNAMTFQWGKSLARNSADVVTYMRMSSLWGPQNLRFRVLNIIVTHLPNTLLLVGTADLIIFLAGLPLALYLGRRTGGWVDRLVSLLTPLASIPPWVHGILLVLVFSVWLGVLPYGRMFDHLPPDTPWGYFLVVVRHMILPVTAILLSLFLQCVTAWRSFFFIFSREDYVELAVAKGVPGRVLERRHILRPTLPYIITSFTLTLLTFWQMTTALEYFFGWPGIGLLFVEALHTFDMLVAIGIVVIFAYLLGAVIFLLDIAYAVVDPRIRLGEDNLRVREPARRWKLRPGGGRQEEAGRLVLEQQPRRARRPMAAIAREARDSLSARLTGLVSFLGRLMRQPGGAAGLFILLGLAAMSVYALTAYPAEWKMEGVENISVTDPVAYWSIPRNALPAWVNSLTERDLPETLAFGTRDGTAEKTVDGDKTTILFTFDYPYRDFPQEVFLLFEAPGQESPPFASLTWTKPNGEEIDLRQGVINPYLPYDFSIAIPRLILQAHGIYPLLRTSNDMVAGRGGLPVFTALFSASEVSEPVNLEGTYTLRIDAITFEPGAQLEARLILVGRVYGLAGTDNWGGDLLIPLVWGAPLALGIGLLGAFLTTLVSMVIAAVAAWSGGWVDGLVERLSEASMVMPFLAIGILLYFFFHVSLGAILVLVVLLNALGSPVKAYRAAFLQVRQEAYIEAARVYGAGNGRIILRYLMPRISPVLVPQLTFLIPGFVFLEATLAIFGVSGGYASWGTLIYMALRTAALQHNYFWLAEPIVLLLITGLGFSLLGMALERVLDNNQVAGGNGAGKRRQAQVQE